MSCHETSRLLDAYVDGELDLAAALAVEDHVQSCARCKASLAGMNGLRRALRSHAALEPAPESLQRRLLASLAPRAHGAALSRGWAFALAAPGIAASLLPRSAELAAELSTVMGTAQFCELPTAAATVESSPPLASRLPSGWYATVAGSPSPTCLLRCVSHARQPAPDLRPRCAASPIPWWLTRFRRRRRAGPGWQVR